MNIFIALLIGLALGGMLCAWGATMWRGRTTTTTGTIAYQVPVVVLDRGGQTLTLVPVGATDGRLLTTAAAAGLVSVDSYDPVDGTTKLTTALGPLELTLATDPEYPAAA